MSLLVGLDLGSTSIKALAYDPNTGKAVGITTTPTPTTHSNDVLSDHEPSQLWDAVCKVFHDLSKQVQLNSILAIGISSFGDTGVPLDRLGRPLYPFMAWYDQRCIHQTEWFTQQQDPDNYYRTTGMRFSTSSGISKWLWFRENFPIQAQSCIRFLSVMDYITWRLCGEYVIDFSSASRMGVFDQNKMTWSDFLLDLCGLQRDMLSSPVRSGTHAGNVIKAVAKQTGLPFGIPVVVAGHDHLCAVAACGAVMPGALVDSCGTAQSLLLTLPEFNPQSSYQVAGYAHYAHVIPDQYVLRGGLRSAGDAIARLMQWLYPRGSNEHSNRDYRLMEKEATHGFGRLKGPMWLPHLFGSGTPLNNPKSHAAIVGINPDHTRGDFSRGLLESLAFWIKQNVDYIQSECNIPIQSITLVGGVTQINLLSHIKADVLNRSLLLPDLKEPSALGAALLAGIGAETFSNFAEAKSSLQIKTTDIYPDPIRAEFYNLIYENSFLPLCDALNEIHCSLSDP
jgi:xylulokinase